METTVSNQRNPPISSTFNSASNGDNNKSEKGHPFPEGTLVTVANRTWPGINKPGGAGKVIRAYRDESGVFRADVKYLVGGGSENKVEIQYITKQIYLETNKRRRRQSQQSFVDNEPNSKHSKNKVVKSISKRKKNNSSKKKKNDNVKKCCNNKKNQTVTPTPEKRKKRVRTNPKPEVYPIRKLYDEEDEEDESIEPSIPREITIVSCAASTGSLSFNENLINTKPKNKWQKKPNELVVRNHKKLTQAATNNRKMTEFFVKSPSQPPLGLKSKNSKDLDNVKSKVMHRAQKGSNCPSGFNIHRDTKEGAKPIIRRKSNSTSSKPLQEKNKNVNLINSSVSQSHSSTAKTKSLSLSDQWKVPDESAPAFTSEALSPCVSEPKSESKTDLRGKKQERDVPKIDSMNNSPREQNESFDSTIRRKLNPKLKEAKQDTNLENQADSSIIRTNSSSLKEKQETRCKSPLLSKPNPEKEKEEGEGEDPQPNQPERIDLFITVFMNIIKQVSEIISFADLMKEVNKRMIKNDKFNEEELNECVIELEKRNRVMFDKEEGTIYWI